MHIFNMVYISVSEPFLGNGSKQITKILNSDNEIKWKLGVIKNKAINGVPIIVSFYIKEQKP